MKTRSQTILAEKSARMLFHIRLCWSVRCCLTCSKFRTSVRNSNWLSDANLCEEIRKHSVDLYHREAKLACWYTIHLFHRSFRAIRCFGIVEFGAVECPLEELARCAEDYDQYLTEKLLSYNKKATIKNKGRKKKADGNILSLFQRTALRDKSGIVYKRCTVCMTNVFLKRKEVWRRPYLPYCFACDNGIRLFFKN